MTFTSRRPSLSHFLGVFCFETKVSGKQGFEYGFQEAFVKSDWRRNSAA